MVLTVISHVYNEEYLIPFWLKHHKSIFDHGIIIDYNSTDRTLDIIREICPAWEIIQSRNDFFDAQNVDMEVMDIERNVVGTKIVLNTTEFLFTKEPLILAENTCFSIQELAALSDVSTSPKTLEDLFEGIQRVNEKCRGKRFIHSYPCGQYSIGRHGTYLNTTDISSSNAIIIWFGFYPWNDEVIKRKQQIGKKQPESDIAKGLGSHHRWNLDEMLNYKSNNWQNSIPYTINNFINKDI